MTKRERAQSDKDRETLCVAVATVQARVGAASPAVVLWAEMRASLTLQGVLSGREPKRRVVITLRRCDPPVGGRVFPQRQILKAWLNLPPVLFAEVSAMALSGELERLELTTEKLRRNAGAVLAAGFFTRELRVTAVQEDA